MIGLKMIDYMVLYHDVYMWYFLFYCVIRSTDYAVIHNIQFAK